MNKDYAHSMQDDIIYRQDAIDALMNDSDWADAIPTIESLPSAETKTRCIAQITIDRDDMEYLVNEKVNEIVDKMSEPKTGHWIRCKEQDEADLDNGNALYECSNCGHTDLHAETQEVPYCWFCGSDMRGDKNG